MKITLPLILGASALLTACSLTSSGSSQSAPQAPVNTDQITDIAQVKFSVPKQIQWQSSKNKAGNVLILTPKGSTVNNSRVKIVYQLVGGEKTPQAVADAIIAPLKNSCGKVATKQFETASKYPNTVSTQTICNQIKGTKVGLINNTSVYSDSKGSYVLITELVTPASAEPGQFNQPKSKAEKQQMQGMMSIIPLLQQVMTDALVCDAQNKCI